MVFKKKRRWHALPGQVPTEFDREIMKWESRGRLVPTRDLIKTPEQIEGIRRGCIANIFITEPIPSIDYIPYAYTSPTVRRVFLQGIEYR